MEDYGYAIEEAEVAGDLDQVGAIVEARGFASEKGLLPKQASISQTYPHETGYFDQSYEASAESSSVTSTEGGHDEHEHEERER